MRRKSLSGQVVDMACVVLRSMYTLPTLGQGWSGCEHVNGGALCLVEH